MAAPHSAHGVDAVVEEKDEHRPFCEHGPTQLFERYFKDRPPRRFYACSACRDRKDCSFFQWEDEKVTAGKQLMQQEIKKKLFRKKKKAVKILKENDSWCYECGVGVLSQNMNKHDGHTTKLLKTTDISSPTCFINPKENKKFNAQYYFDKDSCNFLLTTIKRLKYKNIICIGTPRFFEVLNTPENDLSLMLLDIDKRFEQFYSPDSFQRYNMFNNFFFNTADGKDKLQEFVQNAEAEEILIIADPPFGGLVNLLSKTLNSLWKMGGELILATMLIFPYFLETHVEENLEDFVMLDYKVSYENHPHYCNSTKNLRGSPVRIFTNIPADRVALPKEGYRFCKLCQRYVYNENKHCKNCKLCTSKDGRTYVHCNECKTCVKPGRVHCEKCGRCEPEKHICGREIVGCHICGELAHKRRNCPKKEFTKEKKSRKRVLQEHPDSKAKGSKKKKSSKVKIRI